jgi:hypothetical protein
VDYNAEVHMRSYRESIYNICLNITKITAQCNGKTLGCERGS